MTTKTDEQQRRDFESFLSTLGLHLGKHERQLMFVAYLAGRAALQSQDRELCFWTHNEEIDAYATTCGNAFIVGEGTPTENSMKFCCYCGGSLVEHIDHARRVEGDGE